MPELLHLNRVPTQATLDRVVAAFADAPASLARAVWYRAVWYPAVFLRQRI